MYIWNESKKKRLIEAFKRIHMDEVVRKSILNDRGVFHSVFRNGVDIYDAKLVECNVDGNYAGLCMVYKKNNSTAIVPFLVEIEDDGTLTNRVIGDIYCNHAIGDELDYYLISSKDYYEVLQELKGVVIENPIDKFNNAIDILIEDSSIGLKGCKKPLGANVILDDSILEKLVYIVNGNYDSEVCGATCEWSSGNEDDVFKDGVNSGRSWLAYDIGQILGMDLKEPKEPKFSWEE